MPTHTRSTAKPTKVPLLDLTAQYREIEAEILESLRRVCTSQRFILGPEVAALEAEAAAYCGSEHGIGMSSGTDALLAALMALEVGPGDEVVMTPFTFFATAGVAARLGARPFFCDIEPATFNLAAGQLRDEIERRCEVRDGRLVNRQTGGALKVLMPVYLFGQMAEMTPLLELAREHGLRVVEDAAQAIGAADDAGRRAGTLGEIGCFSFFPTKNLGGLGDGGLCTTNDPELAERLRILRVHGGRPKYHHAVVGGNFRLDEIQAAPLRVKLPRLDGWTEGRQRNAARYDRALGDPALAGNIVPPAALPGYRHIYNQYVVRARRRDELRAFLTERGIGSEIYYPIPLHLQECFAYLGHAEREFPESVRAAREVLALPIYPELAGEQLDWVVESIARFYD